MAYTDEDYENMFDDSDIEIIMEVYSKPGWGKNLIIHSVSPETQAYAEALADEAEDMDEIACFNEFIFRIYRDPI